MMKWFDGLVMSCGVLLVGLVIAWAIHEQLASAQGMRAPLVYESPAQGYAPIILSISPDTPDTAQVCAQQRDKLASCRPWREVRTFLESRDGK